MVQTAGFGFSPNSAASGAESRIMLSGRQGAPLQFVDGASLVPRSNAEVWLAGRLAGVKAMFDGVNNAVGAVSEGISQSGENSRERRKFLTEVELKREDQRLREKAINLGFNNPLDKARERLLRAQTTETELYNERLRNPWDPTKTPAPGLHDVTPEDMPKEDLPDATDLSDPSAPLADPYAADPSAAGAVFPDPMQEQITTGQTAAGAGISPASGLSTGAWIDQGNGMYTTTTIGPDGKPLKQFTAVPDPKSHLGYRIINITDLAADRAKQEKADKGEKLLQDQMKVVTNIESARFTLGEITKKLDEISARGPVTGTVRGANPYDVEAQSLENMVNSLVPGLARGVFGEVGVLTDKDVERYKRMIPNIKTDPSVAKKIVDELNAKLDSTLKTNLEVWESAGYNVEGLKSKFSAKKQSNQGIEISTKAEYDKLKSGDRFIFNGRPGIKP